MYENFEEELNKLKQDFCFRKLIPVDKCGDYIFVGEKKYLNLNSNDYLGIAGDEKIRQGFYSPLLNPPPQGGRKLYSLGSASSRLLCGNDSVYKELEDLLSSLYKKTALVFNSGYHANVGILSGLCKKGDVIFSDKLNHASIIDGMKLSGADFHRYRHFDYENLKSLLEKSKGKYKNTFIVTESLFSMDGDIADLKKLVELKQEFNAILIVDEAHAFGCFGDSGLGVCERDNLIDKIDVIVATFGKAVGSMGAFCIADEILIDYLKNKSRTLIFSTALPEISITFSKYVIESVFPSLQEKRAHLLMTADKLRCELAKNGLKTAGESYIVPVILGENEAAVEASKKAQDAGYYLLPIRHPTVPKGSARLRISLSANIEFEKLNGLIEALK